METREAITVDARALRRFEVLAELVADPITRQQAAGLLGLPGRRILDIPPHW